MYKNDISKIKESGKAYEEILKLHEKIEEAKNNQEESPETLDKLYEKELMQSLFLQGIFTKNYGIYNPY